MPMSMPERNTPNQKQKKTRAYVPFPLSMIAGHVRATPSIPRSDEIEARCVVGSKTRNSLNPTTQMCMARYRPTTQPSSREGNLDSVAFWTPSWRGVPLERKLTHAESFPKKKTWTWQNTMCAS